MNFLIIQHAHNLIWFSVYTHQPRIVTRELPDTEFSAGSYGVSCRRNGCWLFDVHAMVTTQQDIAHTVGFINTFMQIPGHVH